MGTITLNTTDSGSGYTYSESNTKATKSGTSPSVLFANRGITTGEYYWEWDISIGVAAQITGSFGVAQASCPNNAIPGLDTSSLGWSANINNVGRHSLTAANGFWHDGSAYSNSTSAFGTLDRLIIRCWMNFDTGRMYMNWSTDGVNLATTAPIWRTAIQPYIGASYASLWDTSKVWYPTCNLEANGFAVQLLSTEANCIFSLPPGAKYLGDTTSDGVPPDTTDDEFDAWLQQDADRVLLVEADYSTGEDDLEGFTTSGLTVQGDGLTILNDVEDQPGNGFRGFANTNATIAYGEKKYFEVVPKYITDNNTTYIGVAISGSTNPTDDTGTNADEFGCAPDGDQLLEGAYTTCVSCIDTVISTLSPVGHYKFDEPTGVSAIADASGNGYNGLSQGATTGEDPIADETVGNSILVNIGGWVEIDELGDAFDSEAIIAWSGVVKPTALTDGIIVAILEDPDTSTDYTFKVELESNVFKITARTESDSLTGYSVSSAVPATVGGVFLIYAYANATTDEVGISVNGETIVTSASTFTDATFSVNAPVSTSNVNAVIGYPLVGIYASFDSFSFFNAELSQTNVNDMWDCVPSCDHQAYMYFIREEQLAKQFTLNDNGTTGTGGFKDQAGDNNTLIVDNGTPTFHDALIFSNGQRGSSMRCPPGDNTQLHENANAEVADNYERVTVAFWFRQEDPAATEVLLDRETDSGTNTAFRVSLINSGTTLQLEARARSADTITTVTHSQTLNVGQTYFVVIHCHWQFDFVKISIDGENFEQTAAPNFGSGVWQSDQEWYIGSTVGGADHFSGYIDQFYYDYTSWTNAGAWQAFRNGKNLCSSATTYEDYMTTLAPYYWWKFNDPSSNATLLTDYGSAGWTYGSTSAGGNGRYACTPLIHDADSRACEADDDVFYPDGFWRDYAGGQGVIAFCGWVKTNRLPSDAGNMATIWEGGSSTSQEVGTRFRIDTNDQFYFFLRPNTSHTTTPVIWTDDTVTKGAEYFIYCEADLPNDVLKISVNGGTIKEQAQTWASETISTPHSSDAFQMFYQQLFRGTGGTTTAFFGAVDQFAWWRGSGLTQGQIGTLYALGRTDDFVYNYYTWASTYAPYIWYKMDGATDAAMMTDEGTAGVSAGTVTGATIDTGSIVANNSTDRYLFNATSEYIDLPWETALHEQTVLSFIIWIEPTTISAATEYTILWIEGDTASSHAIHIYIDGDTNKIVFDALPNNADTNLVALPETHVELQTNEKYMVYCCIDAVNESLHASVNGGNIEDSQQTWANNDIDIGSSIILGRHDDTTNQYYGYVDNVKVFTKALGQDEISRLYSQGSRA